MRTFALIFAGFVVLAVAALNYIDSRYPGGLRSLDLTGGTPEPAAPAALPAPQQPAPAPMPAAKANAAQSPNDFTAPEVRGLWPGATVDNITYGARRYKDMTVVSISAQTVTLRNEREIVSIPTGSLPADLREMAVAYLNGSDGPPFARVGSPAFPALPLRSDPQPAPQPAASATTTGVAPAPAPSPAPAIAPPVAVEPPGETINPGQRAIVLQAARERAEWWLRYERERRLADIVPLVTGVDLQSVYPVTGLPGYWRVRGRGYVATYQEDKGGTFHDFEITVILDDAGTVLRADIKLL